jgi:hypothetical protein
MRIMNWENEHILSGKSLGSLKQVVKCSIPNLYMKDLICPSNSLTEISHR